MAGSSSTPHTETIRKHARIAGIVQGVGFRPFVYRLAAELGLAGWVGNDGWGVTLEIQGDAQALDSFFRRLQHEAPPLARITGIETAEITPQTDDRFRIVESVSGESIETLISPDIAVCDQCLEELFDPADRRYRYPFINCTNCGPRFTIIRQLPYDRPGTSMRPFTMCVACQAEYDDPVHRRFHAQPNACPVCGPKVWWEQGGQEIETADPIAAALGALGRGQIVAVRGVGGFHLAVDAANEEAVARLRERKGRAGKPFALMARSLEVVRAHAVLTPDDEQLLADPRRPIVLVEPRMPDGLALSVAEGSRYRGYMLPYSPLHHLLLSGPHDTLVMTSGNFSEEPIVIGIDDARSRLAGIADGFLLHNREIVQRCDDAIATVMLGKPRLVRRSRGFVPEPIFLAEPLSRPILGTGSELKVAAALGRGKHVLFGQHVGDLDHPASLAFYEESIAHLKTVFKVEPSAIACDLHPEYFSTRWAQAQPGMPIVSVQHHHAHLASVLAENNHAGRAVGIILDGTGYGTDSTIWGGELLAGDASGFERSAWLETVPMPGGEQAVREPWRMAVAWLNAALGDLWLRLPLPICRLVPESHLRAVSTLANSGEGTSLTSSCGRLFDAVSAILGIRMSVSYEAQAAIELETCAARWQVPPLDASRCDAPVERRSGDGGSLDGRSLVAEVVDQVVRGVSIEKIAHEFHKSVARLFVGAAISVCRAHDLHTVALSGGCFQNRVLLEMTCRLLEQRGLTVLTHSLVPTNDGGLALGQIVIADQRLRQNG